MTEGTLLPFDLPAVQRKKVTADFAGGSISSDGGLVLLRAAERRAGSVAGHAGAAGEAARVTLGDDPANPRYIANERGVGYRMLKPDEV